MAYWLWEDTRERKAVSSNPAPDTSRFRIYLLINYFSI